jgi:hypothetical protein
MLFDDAMHGRQPEPGATFFGGEEGLEDALKPVCHLSREEF